jgi:FkbM family methyltransferase
MKHKIKELYILGIRIGFFNAMKLIYEGKRVVPSENHSEELFSVNLPNVSHPIFLRRFSSDISIFNAIFNDLEYDFPVVFTPKYIIDCGANIGLTSLFLKLKYSESTIIAIEPESSNYEVLKKNLVNYSDIKTVNAGVWSSTAMLQIVGSSSTGWDVETVISNGEINEGQTIKAISISDLMDEFEFEHIDILKIDIEGSERQLFNENYEQWLPKTKILVIELHDMINKEISATFFNTLGKYDFDVCFKGENLICYNKKFVN